jgi:prepilin-type N-terminal cleavage/methylation domain-containing protein
MIKFRTGFTLIELMVVVGILGILILFSSISYLSLKQRTALNSTVDDLVSAARTVQGWAIAGQDGTATQCLRISNIEIKSPCDCVGVACKLQSAVLSGVTVLPLGDISFTRLTGLPTIPVTLNITSAGGSLTKTITIQANGKISS